MHRLVIITAAVVGTILLFAVLYMFGTDSADWSSARQNTFADNLFFSLATITTADPAGIHPITPKSRGIVIAEFCAVVAIVIAGLTIHS